MYELLKQLKDVGYKQEGVVSNWVCRHDKNPYSCMECEIEKDYTQVYEPTTDDLINKLGGDIQTIKRDLHNKGWWVVEKVDEKGFTRGGTAPTVKEALIRLYISLHSK